MNGNEGIVRKFWTFFDEGDFDSAVGLMNPDAIAVWPNTREIFRGREKFLLANKKYPGRWRIGVEKLVSNGNTVVSAVKVESEDGKSIFYAASFFEMKNGSIAGITEYWGGEAEPPEWRKGISERY